MVDMLLLVATWACGAVGFAMLAFSQSQHWPLLPRRCTDQPPGWLLPLGWLLIALATFPAIGRDGLAFGLLLWGMLLTISACAVVGTIVHLGGRA